MSADPQRTVTVTGDITVDWMMIAPPEASALQLEYVWEQKSAMSVVAMAGGAAMIASCLRELGCSVRSIAPPAEALANPNFAGVTRTFAAWATLPLRRGSTAGRWRFREFLGQAEATEAHTGEVPALSDVVVIDDANLGFRSAPDRWEALVSPPGNRTVVVKMASPIGPGQLWDRLASAGHNVVVYVSLGDLRREDAAVGQPLSWERTAREVVAAVGQRPELRAANCVVVGIGLSGAVIVNRSGEATFVYDPERLEGDWEAEHPGIPYGVGAVITAHIARAFQGDQSADVAAAVAGGLALARERHEAGMRHREGAVEFAPQSVRAPGDTGDFVAARISPDADWTLLRDHGGLADLATDVLLRGLRTDDSGIPAERMGAWVSVDRAEIESVRSVRNIVAEYVGQSVRSKPLSIAVFGPPGSGKSFAIKQMAGLWSTEANRLQVLEFNVSQLSGPDALVAAFQRIRDCAVEGSLPLVFWDEFDSTRDGNELGWLAQFLAPMQDGAFHEGSLIRPIGGALFVFAGGTHATMESFKSRASEIPGAKATDFLSRLRGFVDVLGPNPANAADDSFAVRRALLLRNVLLRRAPQLNGPAGLNIDPGVANAFLGIERYVHGARSMESIVEMSALSGRSRFARASLPAAQQLSLHVDAKDFLGLLEQVL